MYSFIFSNRKEEGLLKRVKLHTEKLNVDNVSRTNAYAAYFERNKEIIWAYLASMVSRNAGWNMTDLHSKPFKYLISEKERALLFITYERANWLIFSDAFPQLLIYEESKRRKIPLFSLLKYFHVSQWIIKEWERFWKEKNMIRLIQAQIINEQHLIQKPVIESPFFCKQVFHSFPYFFQEKMHFGAVLLPTIKGELFGRSIKNFTDVKKRIELGKQLATILFHSREKDSIKKFSDCIKHTGSRYDYEQLLPNKTFRTPMLRFVYPYVHHDDSSRIDWLLDVAVDPNRYFSSELPQLKRYDMTDWYYRKRKHLVIGSKLKKMFFS